MRKRTMALDVLALIGVAGGGWYTSLDPETRGIMADMPTDPDVLSWPQAQRDTAFRAVAGPEGAAREAFYRQVQALIDAGK